ncbi:unnamed protein product, partial [Polarella glacialis]
VTCWVSEITETGKLALSMLPLSVLHPGGTPKQDVSVFRDLSHKEWLTAVVTSIEIFGFFADVSVTKDGKTSVAHGLVHCSEISKKWVSDVADEVKLGQEVKVRVRKADGETGRLNFTMWPLDPEAEIMKSALTRPEVRKYKDTTVQDVSAFRDVQQSGQWLTGTVMRTASFGAWVSVWHPIRDVSGNVLVHVTAMRDYFVEDPAQEVEIGQEVRVRITSVDVRTGRMRGSMVEPLA